MWQWDVSRDQESVLHRFFSLIPSYLLLCSSPTKSEFIRAKYQMLAFVHKLPCRDDDGVTTKDLSKVRPHSFPGGFRHILARLDIARMLNCVCKHRLLFKDISVCKKKRKRIVCADKHTLMHTDSLAGSGLNDTAGCSDL